MVDPRGKCHNSVMNLLQRRIAAVLLAAWAAPAAANNIITAEHPPIGPRGWVVQFDDRPTYIRSTNFVNRNASDKTQTATTRQDLLIMRLFLPKTIFFRASASLASLSQNSTGRYGVGDMVFEGGSSLDPGPWRFRLLAFTKAPTGNFALSQGVNIGSGQWDFGPDLYVTRYFDEKRVDVDLQTQYAFKLPNTSNGIRPGNEWTYNLAAARRFQLGVPMRLGVEQRGFLGEPNRRDGISIGPARRSLGIGPVGMIDMGRFVKGFTIWPTMIFDFYDRNFARTQLYYLKLQINI
jgi:hypothetical protein